MNKMLLVVLDGWGVNPNHEHNAIAQAETPFWDTLLAKYPSSILHCKEESVGLPKGCLSGSEVGHTTIGAGRVVWQQCAAIDNAISTGVFFAHEVLTEVKQHLNTYGETLHIVGLLSDGGIHSHVSHLSALIEWAQKENIGSVTLHLFLDGRDMPPKSALELLTTLTRQLPEHVKIATLCGRAIAMDRMENWERTVRAFRAMVESTSPQSVDPVAYVQENYAQNVTDEFIPPASFGANAIEDNDAILFFNFRADRMRQLVKLFTNRAPHAVQQAVAVPANLFLAGMTQYHDDFTDIAVLFPKETSKNTLPEWLSLQGFKQFRIAETEKYAHVTYFFNGGREETFPNEDRLIIPSLGLENYASAPEMSLPEITKSLVRALELQSFDFLIGNIANGDMVGHSGDMSASVAAAQAVDFALSQIVPKAAEYGYTVAITADHGNVECMHEAGQPHTAHTFNNVPFIVTNPSLRLPKTGYLHQLAPTIFDLMNVPKPKEMTSDSLIWD